MIKAIFFDFDGVLTTDSFAAYTTSKYLEEVSGVCIDRIKRCYDTFFTYLKENKDSHNDKWPEFCKCIEKDIDIKHLFEAFHKVPKNEKMFDLVLQLRKNYKVGIITDNTKERFDIIKKDFKLYDKFDVVIDSSEVGHRKKDEIIFKKALEALNVKAEESIFIDNTENNLVVPKNMGFITYFHDDEKNDVERLKGELRKCGLTI